MTKEVNLDTVFKISEDIIVRKIENEILLIPLVAEIADLENEFITLNKTGKDVFERINGKKTLKEIEIEIARDYGVSQDEIEKDVVGFIKEMYEAKILNKVN